MKKKIIAIIVAILIILGLVLIILKSSSTKTENEVSNNETTNIENSENLSSKETENVSSEKTDESNNLEYFVLYEGIEISLTFERQNITEGMDINSENEEKYNISYYNFEDGKYVGKSVGNFSTETETYEGIAIVNNVNKFAFSQYFDAVPYEYSTLEELPDELDYLSDCTSVNVEKIDLDGNGESEYIVCYTYVKDEDGESIAESYIMLLNSNFERIAYLVTLENGNWAGLEDQKVFLSLEDNIEYIDIDSDGIMEIIVDIPQYEGSTLSIVKYDNGEITGETNIIADLEP